MDKYIYDDKNDLWYELQGDYYIPCLILPAEKEQPIGLWGQRHLQYLKEYRRITYLNLLTSGRLNAYLADIDKQAEEMFFRLVEQMKQAQGIMEQLKAENALEWTERLNNIRTCARGDCGEGDYFCIRHKGGREKSLPLFFWVVVLMLRFLLLFV